MAESGVHCASVVTRGELVMSAVSGKTFNLATVSPRTIRRGDKRIHCVHGGG